VFGSHPHDGNGVFVLVASSAQPLQAALSEDLNESPYRVRSVLRVQVSVAAVELQGAGGALLMQASMGGVDSRAVLYPVTQDLAFSVSTVRGGKVVP
jgi:hypothetical protein